ncbi:MAG: hypothetical protein ABW215_07830 [Kibdelosporangium sp.]
MSRPWCDDFSQAQTPARAAKHLADLVLSEFDPSTYGQLVRHGQLLAWNRPGKSA